jgi:hypothetical protein
MAVLVLWLQVLRVEEQLLVASVRFHVMHNRCSARKPRRGAVWTFTERTRSEDGATQAAPACRVVERRVLAVAGEAAVRIRTSRVNGAATAEG